MTSNTQKTTAVVEHVRALCKTLKMPGLARSLDDILRQAHTDSLSALQIIEEALRVESTSRSMAAVRLRMHEARFPDVHTLDAFDFKVENGVDRALMQTLAHGDFVDDKQNIIFVGPVGTGKSHLATAIGIEAVRRRQRVLWFRAADLVRALIEAKATHQLGRFEKRIMRAQLLILDELGFVPFDREGGELLFNLLSARHRKAATVITSNLAFSEWSKVFAGDEKLTAALLDRLAENAVVVVTKGQSYRSRRRQNM